MQGSQKKPSILLLILLISIGTIASQFYSPAIPEIGVFFQVGRSDVAWTMTIFLIGYAVGQLIYGPLGNHYGRRGGFVIGLGTTFFASVLCLVAGVGRQFWLLLVGRFLMAIGSSAGLALTFTVIKDVFSGGKAKRITSIAVGSFSVLPGVVIAISGELTHVLGWFGPFVFMALYSGCIFSLMYAFLPETQQSFDAHVSAEGYKIMLRSKPLILYSAMMGLATSGIYLFATYGPMIAIEIFHMSPLSFGLMNIIPSLSILCGVAFSAALAHTMKTRHMIAVGCGVYLFGALLLALLLDGFAGGIISLFAAVSVMFFGLPIIYSNASVLATHGMKNQSNASALMSAINLGLGSLVLFFSSLFDHHLHILLPVLYTGCALGSFLLLFAAARKRSL